MHLRQALSGSEMRYQFVPDQLSDPAPTARG